MNHKISTLIFSGLGIVSGIVIGRVLERSKIERRTVYSGMIIMEHSDTENTKLYLELESPPETLSKVEKMVLKVVHTSQK